jgi:uncharacterized protein YkwD
MLASVAASTASIAVADSPALLSCADSEALAHAVQHINALRQAGDLCGVSDAAPPLVWQPRLEASATAQASDLAVRDTVEHVDAQNRPLEARLRAVGYRFKSGAENVAAGQTDVDAAIAGWVASRSHCTELMQPRYTEIGLACVERKDSTYGRFWVLHLGRPARL